MPVLVNSTILNCQSGVTRRYTCSACRQRFTQCRRVAGPKMSRSNEKAVGGKTGCTAVAWGMGGVQERRAEGTENRSCSMFNWSRAEAIDVPLPVALISNYYYYYTHTHSRNNNVGISTTVSRTLIRIKSKISDQLHGC